MKKIIALVLALVMVLSLGTVASAKGRGGVKEFVTDTIAHSLQAPANVLANVLKLNQDRIVDRVNSTLPVVFNATQNSALMLDSALQMGAKITEARIMIAGSLVKGATNLVSKVLKSIKVDAGSSAETSINNMIGDVNDLGDMVKGGAQGAFDTIDGIADFVHNVIGTLNNPSIYDIVEIVKTKGGYLWENKHTVHGSGSPAALLDEITLGDLVLPDGVSYTDVLQDLVTLIKGDGLGGGVARYAVILGAVIPMLTNDNSVVATVVDMGIDYAADLLKEARLYADWDEGGVISNWLLKLNLDHPK